MGARICGAWKRIASRTALGGVCLMIAVGSASAGQDVSTGVGGIVTDDSNLVLPGVTVTVSGPSLQGERSSVTDGEGNYRISPIPIGTYDVVFALSGFRTLRREGVRLTAGTIVRVDVSMSVGGV